MEELRNLLNHQSEEDKKFMDAMLGIQNPAFDHLANILPKDINVNPAHRTYEIVAEYIQEFQSNLDLEHEVGAHLVSFGKEYTFNIIDIGYAGPNVIVFYGLDKNQHPIQLVQNINQLNVLLIAAPKLGEKPRRLGFDLSESDE